MGTENESEGKYERWTHADVFFVDSRQSVMFKHFMLDVGRWTHADVFFVDSR